MKPQKDYVTVVWTADDGYVSRDRPQEAKVYLCDVEDDMKDSDIEGLIYEVVEEQFSVTVSFDLDMDAAVAEVKRQKALRTSDDS